MLIPDVSKQEELWREVERCAARTKYDRLGDGPVARRALNAFEAACGGDKLPGNVIPFPRRRCA
jgi:hypothetical protein